MTAIRLPVPSIASVEKRCRAQYNTTDSGIAANRLVLSNRFCTGSRWPDSARAEQDDDVSTLLPELVRYQRNTGTPAHSLQRRLQRVSLKFLQRSTGLSRNTILRARRGPRIHPKSLQACASRHGHLLFVDDRRGRLGSVSEVDGRTDTFPDCPPSNKIEEALPYIRILKVT
jgi:hypothetical protein